jgi:protein-tyrosine phosphatase
MASERAKVADGIFIGSALSLYDNIFLHSNEIGLIINASNRKNNLTNLKIPTLRVHDLDDIIPVTNAEKVRLVKIAGGIANIVEDYRKKNRNVLIHCQAGINRSAFILATYLITKRGYTADQAISAIQAANNVRGVPALTNIGFVQLLRGLEKKL